MKENLIGHAISRIQYVELNNPEKEYRRAKYHNVDFAVQLVLENEAVYHFGWDTTFEQFLLKKDVIEIPPHLENYKFRVWEVESDPAWVPFIGKEIADIEFELIERYWKGGKKVQAPTSMTIKFADMTPKVTFQIAEPAYDLAETPKELKPIYDGHIWICFI